MHRGVAFLFHLHFFTPDRIADLLFRLHLAPANNDLFPSP
jgi:hypothetical protein